MVFIAACFFAACKNDPPYNDEAQLAIDDDKIKAYLDSNNIKDVKKSPDGVYYKIITAGTDPNPVNLKSYLSIHYVGRLMANQVLYDSTATNDTTFSTKFILKDAIKGWQVGIPLVHAGGRIRLIVPSPLAYQNRPISNILVKPNSILDFDIQLIRVTEPISNSNN